MVGCKLKSHEYHQVMTNSANNGIFRSIYYVYACCFTANLLLVSLGSCLFWAAPVLPKLLSNDTNVNPFGKPINTMEVSIIAGCQYVGTGFGFLIMAKVCNWLGRKKTMRYSGLSLVAMLFILAFARSIYVYIIPLLVLGLNLSGIYISVSVYDIEISEVSNRSKIGSMLGISAPTGIFIGYVVGAYTSIQVYTLLIAIPTIINLVLEPLVIVESPVYLASKGRDADALSSLRLLRSTKTNEEVIKEYAQIEKTANSFQITTKRPSVLDMFKTKASRKALFLGLLLCIGQQTCGSTILLVFSGLIFNFADSVVSPDTIGIIMGITQLVIYFIVGYLYNIFGARKLMLISSSVCSICMLFSSIFFYLIKIKSPLPENLHWLPILLTILFITGYGMGYGFLPISLTNELFSTDLRSIGFATSMLGESFFVVFIRFSYPFLSENLGDHFGMFIYFLTGLFNFVCFLFWLPDTKDKSFQEIQIELSK
uniref:Facilitated trehalose transporter Tret1-like n=1 Tax=Diabrotica virgifera virgifera TaxID=50390 RepID=A0A6P7GL75_DIAVI